MTQLSRSASLTGFVELARSLRLDPCRLAEAAGVPAPALIDPDLRIPASSVNRLLEAAAKRAKIDNFGLRLAETRRLSNMGAVALVARDQPSLRKALDVMGQYQWMQTEGLSLLVEEADDLAIIKLHFAVRRLVEFRQAIELCVGVLRQNLRALLGESWKPRAVLFHHERAAKLDVHLRVFGVEPQFNQDADGLVILRRELDAPLASSDPVLARHAESYIGQLAQSRRRTMREMAGELIVLLLPTGTCTAERAARHLGVDRRTLHRKLVAEGTDFTKLVDEKRGELVLSLLTDRWRSLGAIANLAGFAGPSSFSHWFRRRFGHSPKAFRERQFTKA